MRNLLCAAAALALVACASNGHFASKSNPVDYQVTLQRVCTGLHGLDAVAKGLASGQVLTPSQADAEAAAFKLLNTICDPTHPPTDLAGAVATVAVAATDLGDVIAAVEAASR